MLMIAISIVSHRMSNSFAEPRQPSLLSLTCMFKHLFSISLSLQKRKERVFPLQNY